MRSRRPNGSLSGSLCSASAALLLLAGGALTGCTASSEDVRPPPDQFFFPTGLAIDSAQGTLFVANANSELRYDSGSINAVNLDAVDAIVGPWVNDGVIPAGCQQDPEQPETLICDEAQFISAAVRIGNFATSVAVQDTGNGNGRLIVPTRGDPSITWIDWVGGELSCEANASGFSICDDRHRLTLLRDDEELGGIPEEPFRAYVDSVGQYAVVTHLSSGTVSLVHSPIDGTPVVADALGGLFQPGDLNFSPGGSGIAGRLPGAPDNLIYAVTRTEDRVQMLTVDRNPEEEGALPFLVSSNYFFLNSAGGNNGQSRDSRGIAFTDDGNTMAIINRRPSVLLLYDTSIAQNGLPRNEPKAVYDICREASGVVVGAIDGQNLALASCFREGLLYIIDAQGRRPTDAVVTVGRGPNDVVMSASRKKAYVTNFLEDTIGVIDLAPGSKGQNREVLRIGEKRL